jgi:hypothetical protein
MTIKHAKTSMIADGLDTDLVLPSDWNADHTLPSIGELSDVNVATVSGGNVLTWDAGASEWIASGGVNESGQFTAVFDGGGVAPAAGAVCDIVAPHTGTLTSWEMLGNVSGSAVVKVGKDAAANFPPTFPTDLITASAPPTLTSAARAASSTLTGWTTSITAGDILRFEVVSASTLGRVTCVLHYSRP